MIHRLKKNADITHHQIHSKRGLTMIELVVAMAIATIVGAMALMMFIFPQRITDKGEKKSDIQFDLRMVSMAITDLSRLASDIEILPEGTAIPSSLDADNHDIYLFIRSSDNAFVKRDQSGDEVIVQVADLNILFETSDTEQALLYSVSGSSDGASFSLASQVLPLNLSQETAITDSSGLLDGTIVRIENNFALPDANSLRIEFFEIQNSGVGSYYQAEFRVSNQLSENLIYTMDIDLLPPGLSFSAVNGTISGTPTTAGRYQVVVHLTDGIQNATLSIPITIADEEGSADENLPTISGLLLSGTVALGNTVNGQYATFEDTTEPDPLPEGESTAIWYTKASPAATVAEQRAQISPVQAGETFDYTIQSADVGQYLYFEIIPVNEDGVEGDPVAIEAVLVEYNTAPSVSMPVMSPDQNVNIGVTLEASFRYIDLENDPMSYIEYTWYQSNSNTPSHSSETVIASGTISVVTPDNLILTYTTTKFDKNKYISLELVPHATTGVTNGDTVRTDAVNILNK